MQRGRILFAVFALTIVLVGVEATSVHGVKRIGAAYPIQFVFYATETCPLMNPCRPFKTNDASWTTLPRSPITVQVGGDYALIMARFTAESTCVGGDGYCSVRVILKAPGGAESPMEPNAGIDLAFDSTGGDGWESHSIEQVSPTNVPTGNYQVFVQVSTHAYSGSTGRPTFQLDNWTFGSQAAW